MPRNAQRVWFRSRRDVGFQVNLEGPALENALLAGEANRRAWLVEQERDAAAQRERLVAEHREGQRQIAELNALVQPGNRLWTWDQWARRPVQNGAIVPRPEPPQQVNWAANELVQMLDVPPMQAPVLNAEQVLAQEAALLRRFAHPLGRAVRADGDRNKEYATKYKHVDLKARGKGPSYDRPLRPFRVEYDTAEQIDQKLLSSVILIQGWPYYVAGTFTTGGRHGLLLMGNADDEGSYEHIFFDEIEDFRTAAPGYITGDNQAAYWLHRSPERQNRQGMDQRNTFLKPAGLSQDHNIGARWQPLVRGLSQRKNVFFQSSLVDLFEANVFSSMRLNNNLALHRVKNKGTSLGVEYIGRPLGLIINGRCKVFDTADLEPSWIIKDCSEVNLELVA